ncbi:hypothetical protein GSY69_07555 [Brevibacterium sp. 5221]|uniref:GAP family protein n=1 Tax=Brevibacterium rongguiense TaxID=2695267 RepID=A0A6N9H6U5_9MICO|nr:hypothetical protein [Brevibacterium rongguiense]MYM19827.1 hypothetical protein [Brevibacterium rongguiense]
MTAIVSAAISLVGLGFAMGFSPTLYALVLRLLTRSAHAARSIRWITVGLTLGALFLLLLFRVVDPETLTALLRADTHRFLVHRSVDAAAAALLLLGGAIMLARLRRPPRDPHLGHRALSSGPGRPDSQHRDPERPGRMVLIGLAESIISVSGLATMYVTGRVIAAASHLLVVQAVLAVVFFAALAGQYLLLAWAWGAFPPLAHAMTRLYDRVTRIDTRPYVAAALLLAGCVFAVMAVFGA